MDLIEDTSNDVQTAVEEQPFPKNLYTMFRLCLSQHGKAYATLRSKGKNARAILVGSRALDNIIRKLAEREGYANVLCTSVRV